MFSWSYSDITLSHSHTQWLNQQTFSRKHKTSAQLLTQAHIHWKYHCVSTFIRSVNTLINLDIEVVLLHLAACGTRSVPARSNCTMKMIGGLWQCSSNRSLDSTGFFFFFLSTKHRPNITAAAVLQHFKAAIRVFSPSLKLCFHVHHLTAFSLVRDFI